MSLAIRIFQYRQLVAYPTSRVDREVGAGGARPDQAAHGFHATAARQEPDVELHLSRVVPGRNPRRSVIAASYGAELAEDFGRRVRNFMSDPLHAAIFPECRLAADSAAQRRFDTTAGGSYYAVGRGGAVTGRGADLLLLDDLVKDSEEARSETIRRSMHDWFAHAAYTRLAPGGALWPEKFPLELLQAIRGAIGGAA
jgi:hypothetical protein